MDDPNPDPQDPPSSPPQQPNTRPQRVLACVLCQQRKVKCDRKSPCQNCMRAGVQCVSAALAPRQRRRRFAERDLLDRLRHYEDLLCQHKIPFEPMHPDSGAGNASANGNTTANAQRREPEMANLSLNPSEDDSETIPKTKNFWDAMNRKVVSSDGNDEDGTDAEEDDSDKSGYVIQEKLVKKTWDSVHPNDDEVLFCSRDTSVNLFELHPDQIQIFRLWQLYLENVNPFLKVTHTPTLQSRIIEAASDLANINPALEALMFSIYCLAIFSTSSSDCQRMFGSPRSKLLKMYHLGAREALLTCGFWRTADRDVLTALHFYLITVKQIVHPRAFASVLGAVMRIAQQMGIHDESVNSKHYALEAELRRRLWWSLVLFDARMSEMTDFRLSMLLPTWDCKVPSNINDFDFRTEMKLAPEVHSATSEALFALVRAELGNFVRRCSFHLDFVNPAFNKLARNQTKQPVNADDLDGFERMIEEKYLQYCDPHNPLHFMTIWWTRGQLAKHRFFKDLSNVSQSVATRTDAQCDSSISNALAMIQCDTKLMSSKLTAGTRWLIYLNFPFPAYVHIFQDLTKRPFSNISDGAWNIMSENCTARFQDADHKDLLMGRKENPFFSIFASVVVQAWNAREAAMADRGLAPTEPMPAIVAIIKTKLVPAERPVQLDPTLGVDGIGASSIEPSVMPSMDDASAYVSNGDFPAFGSDSFPFMFPQESMGVGMNMPLWGWPGPNLHSMTGQGW